MYRALGIKYAVLVFLLDAIKGALPVWYAMTLFASPIIHDGFMAILAIHLVCLGFKGKGVATAAGVFAVLTPVPFSITFLVVIALIFITRMVSVGTLAGCILLPILLVQFNEPQLLVVSVSVIAFFIVLKHRGNIKRIVQGTENKLK